MSAVKDSPNAQNNVDDATSSDFAGKKNEGSMQSTLVSRNITVQGHRTSIRLEPEMWLALRDIAQREHCKIHDLCSMIAARKNSCTSLTAAIRVFLMLYFRAASTEEGHQRAGHGNFAVMMARARMTLEQLRGRSAAVREYRAVDQHGHADIEE